MDASLNRQGVKTGDQRVDIASLVEETQSQFFQGLGTLLDNVLNDADDTFFALAEKSDHSERQQAFFEIMRMLRLQRANIVDTFNSTLADSFNPATGKFDSTANTNPDEDNPAPMDLDSIEENVAVVSMHSKAMQMYREKLQHLGTRIDLIATHTPQIFPKEAFGPKNLCEAFHDAIAPISEKMEIQNKLILYKLFDKKLVCHLGDLYANTSRVLTAAGVAAKKTTGQMKSPSPPATSASRAEPTPRRVPDDDKPSLPATSANRAEPTPKRVSDDDKPSPPATSASRAKPTPRRVPDDDKPSPPATQLVLSKYFSRNDILGGLSLLQVSSQRISNFTAEQLTGELVRKIGTLHEGASSKVVSQVDCKTIDLIVLLFDTIIKDSGVPTRIKPLMLRLRIPVLRCAILDSKIFTDKHHPSRKLLNGLVNIKLHNNGRDDTLFPRLESIVDVLVDNFDRDIAPFQIASNSLNGLIHKQNVKLIGATKRKAKETPENNARVIVLKEIRNRVRGKNFPKSAHKLVLNHWASVMVDQYTKYGVDSDRWFESIATLEQVVACLQINNTSQATKNLASNFPALRQKLVAEMLKINLKPEEIRDAIDGFNTARGSTREIQKRVAQLSNPANSPAHLLTPSKSDGADVEPAVEPAVGPGNKSIEAGSSITDDSRADVPASLDKLPAELTPGTWVNLHRGPRDPKILAKLSVIIPETATLIFIDKEGFKSAEKHFDEFLTELDKGLSTLIVEDSVIDKALSSVFSSLNTY